MITKDENLLVKLVKKVVGLPTGNSDCCGATALPKASACCDTTASESASKGCGCASTKVQDAEHPAEA